MIYTVSATVTISIFTHVEADSEKEALEIAEGRPMCSLGNVEQYGESPDECWCHSGELDGTPENLSPECPRES